jgi:subtilase family serine protease
MRHPRALLVAAALALSVVAIVPAAIAAPPDDHPVPPDAAANGLAHRSVCPSLPGAQASCRSEVAVEHDGVTPRATKTWQGGLRPQELASAYSYTRTTITGTVPTIAIVDAYDNPNAASDLAAYRSGFTLGSCTGGVSCFTKVNQVGSTSSLPRGDVGWGQEIDLDIEMAAAVCPQCKILLVEANSASLADLATATAKAASWPGVVAVSNSYGTSNGSESSSWVTAYGPSYTRSGVAITVAAGDSGYGVSFPDDLNSVVSVGGTRLTSTGGVWAESVWSGTGSGCSAVVTRASWQAVPGTDPCPGKRISTDIAAVADPATGVAVYDSYGSRRGANWLVFGGTSVASPIIASLFALNSGAHGALTNPASGLYAAASTAFHDIVSGSNGSCAATPVLCTAGTGYDGPTGRGTPNGLTAF